VQTLYSTHAGESPPKKFRNRIIFTLGTPEKAASSRSRP
jgi:hypothetical protein